MSTPNRFPKYAKGQNVQVRSWTQTTYGRIADMQWVYHHRAEEYTWGYRIEYDDPKQTTGFSFVYVPEGYLSPIEETKGN